MFKDAVQAERDQEADCARIDAAVSLAETRLPLSQVLMRLTNVDVNFGIELSLALLMCVAILSRGRSRLTRRARIAPLFRRKL